MLHHEREMRILTYRLHGYWIAIDDDTHYYSDDPKGRGITEAEAIEDLKEQLREDESNANH